MTKTRAVAALSIAAALLAPAASWAAEEPALPNLERIFSFADANGDGRIDSAELAAQRERMFARVDRNKDGFVSAEERDAALDRMKRFVGLLENRAAPRFERLDKDGDGKVSREEFTTSAMPVFALIDINGDGAIDKAEAARIGSILATLRN